MASCQSDLLSIMITAASFQRGLFRFKFAKISCFSLHGGDLFLQVPQLLDDVFFGFYFFFFWSVWSELLLLLLHNLPTKRTRSESGRINQGFGLNPRLSETMLSFPFPSIKTPSLKQPQAPSSLTVVTVLLHHWNQLATADFHTACLC